MQEKLINFWIFWKFFLGNNLKWKLILLLIFYHQILKLWAKMLSANQITGFFKKWMMKCIFGMEINIKVFYKLIAPFCVCAIRYARGTQNKFTYLCNISRKAWEMKLIFCLQINTSFLQLDSITLRVLSQACSKYPKQQVCNIFAIS